MLPTPIVAMSTAAFVSQLLGHAWERPYIVRRAIAVVWDTLFGIARVEIPLTVVLSI
jgi:hypothetical protein